jgi:hypothetical protein
MHRIRQSRIFRRAGKSSRPAGVRLGQKLTTKTPRHKDGSGTERQSCTWPSHHLGGSDFGLRRRTKSRQKVTGIRFRARNEASGLALRVKPQTRPQTTFGITPAVTFGLDWQQTARLSRQIELPLAFGIDCQVAAGFAPQTGVGTGVKVAFGLPFRVTVEIAPGTVPGTVPKVIRGMSIQATSTVSNTSSIRCLARSGLACPRQLPSSAWPVGLRARKAVILGARNWPPGLFVLRLPPPIA